MALPRSNAPARTGRPLSATVVLPAVALAVLIALATALLVSGGGTRAANKELDARAATVKKAWDGARRPSGGPRLQRLGRQLNAQLRVVPGRRPQAGTTSGEVRSYGFATRAGKTLRVKLSTKRSADAVSHGLLAGLIVGLVGALLLGVLVSALLRTSVSRPLSAIAQALVKIKGGNAERAPMAGAREVHVAASAFNELADRAAELDRAAGTDPLTGLPSGPRVRQALEIELKRSEREMAPMALAYLDLDDLKKVNDAHGRQAGDTLLRGFAERVGPMLRATDVFGRVIGDEFALILHKATADHVEMIIARAREAVADLELAGFKLTFSAGYSLFPSDGRDGDTLMQAAEGALKLAQRDPGSTRRFDRNEISLKHQDGDRHEVLAVIEDPEGLTPVFQPLVALATGQVSGYEALTRFRQPPKRFPDQWFNLAARVGLGGALEAHAIKKALDTPGRPPGTYLSLNLSPSTLRAPEVQAVLPGDLTGVVIEVTEHELASDDAALAADLAELRRRGARIAVDDAGAGYSGLQQLMRVAPDLIKLDRSLVQNIHEDPAKQALVDSFVRFGRRTGAQVVAEGIETEEELRVLADLDVTYGQGYFLAKPGPPWIAVSPWVSEKLLRRSLGGQMSAEDISKLPVGSDQRLAAVAARVARAATLADVEALLPVVAEEIGADELVLFTRGYDGALAATSPRPWLPESGHLDLTHFPSFEGALRTGDPEQFLVDRGSGISTSMGEVALLSNSGFGSLLIVPVGPHALLQAFQRDERPWSRAQQNRALVLAYQLAPLLATLSAHPPAAPAL
ncbi:MAG TPA: EAL domain-containing protein [Thermoleophilaceae bacterium]|nr:EAL domain-containing protein [Thermoleophilaceae bacterium]